MLTIRRICDCRQMENHETSTLDRLIQYGDSLTAQLVVRPIAVSKSLESHICRSWHEPYKQAPASMHNRSFVFTNGLAITLAAIILNTYLTQIH